MPAGAFIFLKKSIVVLNTPPGAPKAPPEPPKALKKLPQTLPKLLKELPELTQRPAGPPERPGADPGGGFTDFLAESDGRVVKYEGLGTLPVIPVIPVIPRIPRIPRKWCQQAWLGPYPPHAPGARMT